MTADGQVFNAGHQYQTRMQDTTIIMYGRVYYQEPITWAGTGGAWVCVDLKTGQEVWRNQTMSAQPSFGWCCRLRRHEPTRNHQPRIPMVKQLWHSNSPTLRNHTHNTQHYKRTIRHPSCRSKRRTISLHNTNDGTSASPKWRLYEWNSSRVFAYQTSGTFNASLESLIQVPSTAPNEPYLPTWDFNVTLSTTMPSTWSPTIRAVVKDDYILCTNGTVPTAGTSSLYYHNQDVSTFFAISLNPGKRRIGTIMWTKNIDMTYVNSQQPNHPETLHPLSRRRIRNAGNAITNMGRIQLLHWRTNVAERTTIRH